MHDSTVLDAGQFLAISGVTLWLYVGWRLLHNFKRMTNRLRTLPRRLAWALWR